MKSTEGSRQSLTPVAGQHPPTVSAARVDVGFSLCRVHAIAAAAKSPSLFLEVDPTGSLEQQR